MITVTMSIPHVFVNHLFSKLMASILARAAILHALSAQAQHQTNANIAQFKIIESFNRLITLAFVNLDFLMLELLNVLPATEHV